MTEVPPAARAVVAALTEAPTAPTKILVTGGIGTGKSTVVAALAQVLREAGVPTRTRVSPSGTGALIVDDADRLGDEELRRLTALAEDPETTLVIAAQPCTQHAGLRGLTAALERDGVRAALGPLSRIEVARRCEAHDPDWISAAMAATAGLPFLVDAVRGSEDLPQAGYLALVARLRRAEEALLDTLLIMSLTPGLGSADVAAALRIDGDAARDLVDRAYATGLLDPNLGPRFGAMVHRAVAALLGAARHLEIETALLQTQLEISTLTTELALRLAEHGMREPALATTLEDAARRSQTTPAGRARLYRGAITAHGSTPPAATLRIEFADALALAGDCSAATAIADELLGAEDSAVRAAGVRIATAVATHDGNSARAVELFDWLGPDPTIGPAVALILAATGDAQGAAAALAVPHTGPPTSTARAARNLADGVLSTFDQPYAAAMARLSQALGGQPATQATPDSPAAVVALTALHAGDPVRARSVLAGAVLASAERPDPVFDHRHRLLQAWLKMQDGQLPTAAADAATIPEPGLHRRDALWRAALLTGLARRNGDTGALQQHWYAAMEVLAEYSVDLFSLLPLGELWVAGARIRQEPRLSHQLDEAFGLLHRLGDPPAWSLPLHWAGVHAAILTKAPEAMAPHAQALSTASAVSPFARTLAGAGRAWLRVLANQVDFDDVAAAARGLAQFGLTWDATRLAGQAALQSPDPKVSAGMLQVARDLKLAAGQDPNQEIPDALEPMAARPGQSAGPPGARSPGGALSEREREVAELLVLGKPYRDIGAQLFISAKTVEHHVARIRRRLGAESRSEMLSMLRAILAPQA